MAFLVVLMMVMRPQAADPDIYWHLRSGEVMLETRDIISGDIFSHTKTDVLRPHHEWLSEVIMAVFHTAFGDYGLTALATGLTMLALFLMYRLLEGSLGTRLFLLILAAQASQATSMGRPQIWMLIFSIILVGMVLRRSPKLYWIPVMMLAWGNLHGGWITGYIILGAAVFSEGVKLIFRRGGDVIWLRQLIIWSLVGVFALMLNPYGIEQLLVPLDTFTQAARPFISEWLPPNLLDPSRVGLMALLLMSLIILTTQYKHISLLSSVLLIGFGVWALMTSRVVMLYMFIAPILVAPYLSIFAERYLPSLRLPEYRLNQPFRLAVPLLVISSIGLIVLFWFQSSPARIRQIQTYLNFPVEAVNFLNASPDVGRELFNNYNWGGYLIYYLRDYPVFIDGRADLYDEFFFVYQDISGLKEGWQAALTDYQIRTILIRPDSRLADALRAEGGWDVLYEDEDAVIFRLATSTQEG